MTGIILSIVLIASAFGPSAPQTPRGTQCPTAAVQSITEIVSVRDCCGNLVLKKVQRKPRLGEATFLQCQCAEKKAAEKVPAPASTSESTQQFASAAILAPPFELAAAEFPEVPRVSFRAQSRIQAPPAFAPPTPPPQII